MKETNKNKIKIKISKVYNKTYVYQYLNKK